MVVKVIENTFDSFKDKLKNPFYGTLLIVWIIRNREFIYNVFFNGDCSSDERLEIIRNQFLNWNPVLNFLGTIFISLGLMILIYTSLNLSRFIVEFSERKLKPWIQKLFSATSIVSREDYQVMEKDRDYFQKKYTEERAERIKLQRELDEKANTQYLTVNHNEIQKENESNVEDNQIDGRYFKNWDDAMRRNFKKLIAEINNQQRSHNIEEYIGLRELEEFRAKDLIESYYDDSITSYRYKFTEFGSSVKDYFIKKILVTL